MLNEWVDYQKAHVRVPWLNQIFGEAIGTSIVVVVDDGGRLIELMRSPRRLLGRSNNSRTRKLKLKFRHTCGRNACMFGIRTDSEGPGTQPKHCPRIETAICDSDTDSVVTVVKPATGPPAGRGHSANKCPIRPCSAYGLQTFEVITYQPAICVMTTYALCVTA